MRAAEDPPPPPSIELAARQFLFDYGTRTGLQILRDRVQDLQVRCARTRLHPTPGAHGASGNRRQRGATQSSTQR